MSASRRNLTGERIEELVKAVLKHAEKESWDRAWKAAQPLLKVHKDQPLAATAVAHLLERGAFDRQRGLELAGELFDAHGDNLDVVSALGDAFESLHDINFLNAEPPDDPLFQRIANLLRELSERAKGDDQLITALSGLSTAARVLGRTWDSIAERAYLRLVELTPKVSTHYSLGLFYKTRGRFAEGQAANQRAYDLGGSDQQDVLWNLGICATGARDGETALHIWKAIGQHIEMGRFGLPEGEYDSVKVRLAERPLAARDPTTQPDDPGREETIWVERLSPCHGIVRSALHYDEIGVDFGDVVLFDGAPITHHTYGKQKVPVFPHLATLERPGYQIFRFAGTQQREEQIADLSKDLPDDAVLYVHTEQFVELCSSCWNDPDLDHADHHRAERHLVTGKLCAPPTLTAPELLAALDGALRGEPDVRIFVPDLAILAGDPERAAVERRRMTMIEDT
jgi:hypothetical protein